MILREFFVSLGLDLDSASFAEGEAAVEFVKLGIEKLVEWSKEAVKSLAEMAIGAVETAENLEITAQSIGLTTDALQELRYAGSLAGLGAEEMSQSIRILSRTMYEAKTGAGEQSDAFRKLGVRVTDTHGKMRAADDVIGDIAEKISKLPDGTEKTALAMKFFGRSGAQMVPLLNKGKEGIAELREEAQELGLVLDEETIKKGVEIEHTWKRISAIWTATKNQIGAALFPELLKLAKGIERWIKDNREIIKQRLEQVLRAVAKAAEVVADVFKFLVDNGDSVLFMVKALTAAFLIMNVASVSAAVAAAAAWVAAAAPFIAIGAILAGILLFLDDVRRFKAGKESLIGLWAKTIEDWQKPNENDPWWLKAIKELVVYMEKALGIADKLGVGPNSQRGTAASVASKVPALSYAAKSLQQAPAPGITPGMHTAENNYGIDPEKLKDPNSWESKYLRAREAGLGNFRASMAAYDVLGQGKYVPPAPEYNAPASRTLNYSPSVNVGQITVVSQPGQSAQEIAQTVREEIQSHWDSKMEEANASVP